MAASRQEDITKLLRAWQDGDADAREAVAEWVLAELRSLAHRYIGNERDGHTLQTTALINEAYIRLLDWQKVPWKNRIHFKVVFARLMRHVLVDYGRRRQTDKRGQDFMQVPLDSVVFPDQGPSLLAVDEALTELERLEPCQSSVFHLRFFGGCTVEETAAALNIGPTTVKRDWEFAKAWLRSELFGQDGFRK